MKTLLPSAAKRRSFCFLRHGLFLIISMLAYTRLYILRLAELYGTSDGAFIFFIIPRGRAMLEHTVLTLTVIVACAVLIDIASYEKNSG